MNDRVIVMIKQIVDFRKYFEVTMHLIVCAQVEKSIAGRNTGTEIINAIRVVRSLGP
jgi:hypothetical protein